MSTRSTIPNDQAGVDASVKILNERAEKAKVGAVTTVDPPVANQGGGAEKPQKTTIAFVPGSVDGAAAGVEKRNPQTPTLFGRGSDVRWKGNAPRQTGVLTEGTHVPGLDPQLASLFGKGGGGQMPTQFNGQPTMYPAQQAMGADIFGDTASLFKKRDMLTSQIDSYFAKNPLKGGPMAIFKQLSGASPMQSELKTVNDQIMQRENIMGGLAGHMVGAQAGIVQQGMVNQAGAEQTASKNQNALEVAKLGAKPVDQSKAQADWSAKVLELLSDPTKSSSLSPEVRELLQQMAIQGGMRGTGFEGPAGGQTEKPK